MEELLHTAAARPLALLSSIRRRFSSPQPDFSTLPRLPWVRILSYLDAQDRQAVAQTCWTLRTLCETESILWRSVTLCAGHWNIYNVTTEAVSPLEVALLRKHAGRIRKLNLVLRNFPVDLSDQALDGLGKASESWRLKTLEIYGNESFRDEYIHQLFGGTPLPPRFNQFLTQCLTSATADRLETLLIHDWRFLDGSGNVMVLEMLKNSAFTQSLKHLKLPWFYQDSLEGSSFPSACDIAVVEVVSKFRNLRTLTIPSAYVTGQFLRALSEPPCILLKQIEFEWGCFPAEQIDTELWSQLLASSPALEVHLRVVNLVPLVHLDIIPDFVPVTTVRLHCSWPYGNSALSVPENELLYTVVYLFFKHLRCLEYFEFGSPVSEGIMDEQRHELAAAVSKCPNLTDLAFHGEISADAVLDLASMSRNWNTFRFLDKFVLFPGRGRLQTKSELCKKVSQLLGQSWRLSDNGVGFDRAAEWLQRYWH